jgi:hypothetical protein
VCAGCTAGRFAINESSTECLPCLPGTFNRNDNDTKRLCDVCPDNSVAPHAGATACQVCAALAGVQCTAGEMMAADGFFLKVDATTGAVSSYRCPPGRCKGGTLGDLCAANRDQSADNTLCGNCAPGFLE